MEYLGGLESGIKGRLEALPKLEDAAAAGEIAVRSIHCLVGPFSLSPRPVPYASCRSASTMQ